MDLISFDYAIKYVLKDKKNHDILEGFLSSLLASQGYASPVKIVQLLDTESHKEDSKLKRTLADVVVEDTQGNHYMVEIERSTTQHYAHKACFNTSRLIVDHVSSGKDILEIIKVFHISLLFFPAGEGTIYHGQTIIKDHHHHEPVELVIKDKKHRYKASHIFPEYFFISIPNFNDQIASDMDDWLYAMKHEKSPEHPHSAAIDRMLHRLELLHMSKRDLHDYYAYIKKLATDKDNIETARREGREEMEEKLQESEKKLLQERLLSEERVQKEKRSMAKMMLEKGLDIPMVSEISGLSLEELDTLTVS